MEKKTVKNKSSKKVEFIRFIKYTLFAASAGIIQMVFFELLQLANNYNPNTWWKCYLISIILSVVWNFTFNRKYTFKSANNVPIAMAKTVAFYVVFIPFSVCFGQWYLVDKLSWNGTVIEIVMMVINFVTEFLYQRYFVFRDSIDTNKK